jgi:hypothetical protein
MAGGKAHGVDRQYQVSCRDVLRARYPQVEPWEGDGIDVSFNLPDTGWTIDVALRAPDGALVAAECRRRVGSVKQEDVASFAYKVEMLRKNLGISVSGFFIAKKDHQVGAIKVGQFNGISIVVMSEGETPPGFTLNYLRYDHEREQRLRDIVMGVPGCSLALTGYAPELRHGTSSLGDDRSAQQG